MQSKMQLSAEINTFLNVAMQFTTGKNNLKKRSIGKYVLYTQMCVMGKVAWIFMPLKKKIETEMGHNIFKTGRARNEIKSSFTTSNIPQSVKHFNFIKKIIWSHAEKQKEGETGIMHGFCFCFFQYVIIIIIIISQLQLSAF